MKALKCPKCEKFMFSSVFEKNKKIDCIYCFNTFYIVEEYIFKPKKAEVKMAQNKTIIVDTRVIGIN